MIKKIVAITLMIIFVYAFVPIVSNAKEVSYNLTMQSSPYLVYKDDFKKIMEDISRVRTNLYSININESTTKDNAQKLRKEINFYISEFESLIKRVDEIKVSKKASKIDSIFSDEINFAIYSYKLSLEEQINLIDLLIAQESQASNLFYSDNLSHIYYYITLGDQLMVYLQTYYDIF